MSKTCPSCKADALIWEGYDNQVHGTSQRVCTECGIVVEDGSFTKDTFVTNASSSDYRSYAGSLPTAFQIRQHRTVSKGLKEGRARVQDMTSKFRFTRLLKEETSTLFERCVKEKKFNRINIPKKLVLATACVYLTCLRNRLPVTLRQIAELSTIKTCAINRMKNLITEVMDLERQFFEINTVVEIMCQKAGMEPRCVNLTKQLMTICDETWISQGRNPSATVPAAIYLAWQAHNFLDKHNTTFKDFAFHYNLEFRPMALKRIKEICDTLVVLAQNLPWLNECDAKSVVEYIPDICRYQQSLLMKAKKISRDSTVEIKIETSINKDDSNIKNDTNENSSNIIEDLQCLTKTVKQENIADTNVCSRIKCHRKGRTNINEPPCKSMKSSYKIDTSYDYLLDMFKGDLNAEEIGELDLSDSEIGKYLK